MAERPTPSPVSESRPSSERAGLEPRWIALLHLAALTSIAVGQPLLDVLARDATFFVARRAGTSDLAVLLLSVFAFLPLCLFAVQTAIRALDVRAGRIALWTLVGVLCALIAAPPLQRLLGDESNASLMLASLAGVIAALIYARAKGVRTFLTVLSPAPIVFAALFCFHPAIQTIWRTRGVATAARPAIASDTSLVMVVLDELPLTSLMTPSLEIDAVLFPNFARLAADSTWFRNATASHESTEQALPAIMTGIEPSNQALLPTTRDHPDNIFTLLAGSHRMRVFETFTDVCPPKLAGKTQESVAFSDRARSLAMDSAVVYGHIVLPKPWRERLPSITERWGGFTNTGADVAPDDSAADASAPDASASDASASENGVDRLAVKDASAREDRAEAFERFIGSIDGDTAPTLYFLHVMVPHGPWIYLPSGRKYDPCGASPGYSDGRWSEDPTFTTLAYQRHLLQLGAVDRLLGKLLDRLQSSGVYERALLVVLADHGVSLIPDQFGRRVFPKNAQEIARIPLFFKLPGRSSARVDDTNVETIDILPTIADVMGFELPWKTAGRSAISDREPPRSVKRVHRKTNKPMELDAALPARWPQLDLKVELFGRDTTWERIFACGDAHGLVGQSVRDSIGVAPDLVIELDRPERFGAVGTAADLPCLVKGSIERRGNAALPARVAIAVNGVVRAVTRLYEADGDQGRFAALVPESAFESGSNQVLVLDIDESGALRAIK